MRGREFYWKALYSFSTDEAQHNEFYEKMKQSYMNIYKRAGLEDVTYLTFASGGTFSKFSHEFQTVSDAGEDVIYIDEKKRIAINKEVLNDDVLTELGIDRSTLQEKKAIEVGNIFSLGSKFSEPFELTYKNNEGIDIPVFMGSYGIGITRLMGTVVEVMSDDKGIIWPASISPFSMHLIILSKDKEGETYKKAEEIYASLQAKGVEVLFDDRDESAGGKFADSDLIGIPMRVVVSDKSIAAGGVEIKERRSDTSEVITVEELYKTYVANCE
jgi:prolyl-tRNA synthetase